MGWIWWVGLVAGFLVARQFASQFLLKDIQNDVKNVAAQLSPAQRQEIMTWENKQGFTPAERQQFNQQFGI